MKTHLAQNIYLKRSICMYSSQVHYKTGALCKSFLSCLSFSMTCGAAPEFHTASVLIGTSMWSNLSFLCKMSVRKGLVSRPECREGCLRKKKKSKSFLTWELSSFLSSMSAEKSENTKQRRERMSVWSDLSVESGLDFRPSILHVSVENSHPVINPVLLWVLEICDLL